MTAAPVTITLNANSDLDTYGFHIAAQVAGGTNYHDFQLDTGSSGMAVGVANAGNYQDYPCFGPGQFHYQPSNNILTGYWYLLPVILYSQVKGSDGKITYTAAAKTQCMVLVVENNTSGDSTAPSAYSGGMMGISAKGENINYNALLNASNTQGAPLAPAFVLSPATSTSPATCTIGQTHATGDGFHCVSLQPVSAAPLPVSINQSIYAAPAPSGTKPPPQTSLTQNPVNTAWAMPPVIATVTQGMVNTVIVTAALEIDTGITSMLVAVPTGTFPSSFVGPVGQNGQSVFVDSLTFTINATGAATVQGLPNPFAAAWLSYTFKTGDEPAGRAPTEVILMPPPRNQLGDVVRINTGIKALNKSQYMYDAVNGVMGLKAIT